LPPKGPSCPSWLILAGWPGGLAGAGPAYWTRCASPMHSLK
jgi:hypothetical protein